MGADPTADPAGECWGRHRGVNIREVVNGIFYLLHGMPVARFAEGLPPRSTVHDYSSCGTGMARWSDHRSVVQVRELAGKEASPTAAIIDSQSVKSAERGGADIDPIGYDAGKKVKGVKRHIVVDTLGMLLIGQIHSASVQERDGALSVLAEARRLFPFITKIFADAGQQGEATDGGGFGVLGAGNRRGLGHSERFVVRPRRIQCTGCRRRRLQARRYLNHTTLDLAP